MTRVRLSEEQLAELWATYSETRSEKALSALVVHYEPLARFLARRALSRAPAHQEAEDLISSAHGGLLESIQRFEPERGLKFETYASRRITGAIIDGQRRDDPLSRSARREVSALRDAQAALWESLGRAPTDQELASRLGIAVTAVRHLVVQQQTLAKSLDDEHVELPGVSGEYELVHLGTQLNEVQGEMTHRLAALPERDRAFVLMYYVDRLTLREIGRRLGCSDSRCAQIRKEIVSRLLLTPPIRTYSGRSPRRALGSTTR